MSRIKELRYVQLIIDLFKDFAIWSHDHKASAFTGIVTLLLVGFSFLGFIYTYQKIKTPVEELNKHYKIEEKTTLTPENTQAAFEKFISRNTVIDKMLKEDLDSHGADRAYLFMFHDSLTGLDNQHFFYMSNANEVVRTGVSRELNNLQRLPIAVLGGWAVDFLKNKCVTAVVSKMGEDDPKKDMLQNQGINTSIICPIYSKGILMGFAGFDFLTDKVTADVSNVEPLAQNIRAVLEVE